MEFKIKLKHSELNNWLSGGNAKAKNSKFRYFDIYKGCNELIGSKGAKMIAKAQMPKL